MTRLYATFDPSAVGPALELERSNTVLTYTGASDIHRTARGQDGKSAGVWYAEFLVWGDADIDDLVSLGIVRASASLSTYVGGDADGYGYRLGAGEIHTAGASIESVSTGAKGQIVGLLLDATNATLYVELDGATIATITLPDTGPWHFAASLGGATGYDLRIMCNTGQRAFEYFRRVRSGWFALRESLGMFRFADKPFLTAPTDDPPNERYRGLILDRSALALRGALSFWPMRSGGSAVQSSGGSLRVGNADRSLDVLISGDARDAQVRVLEIPDGGTYADAVQIADLVLNDAQADGDAQIDIRLGDVLDQLDQAVQDRLVRPDADESAADQMWPLTYGACRSISPLLITANPEDDPLAAARYALHDGPVLGLGHVRDGGYPFDPSALPDPDYWLDSLGRLMLIRDPVHALTVDVSSVGGDVPGGPVDILAGAGDFTDPLLWDLHDAAFSGGKMTITNTIAHPDTINAWASPIGLTLEAGKSYRLQFEIEFFSAGLPVYGQRPALVLTGSSNGTSPWSTAARAMWATAYIGRYTAVISPPVDTRLFLGVTATQAGIDSVRVKALKAFQIYTDPVDEESLLPITLEAFAREIIEQRAGWSPASWDAAGFAAIDAATMYDGIGFHAREPASRRAALQAVMDTYCACIWRDDAGVIRVTRLVAPESQPSTAVLTINKMMGEVRPRQDLAPGLTTQARCRKNWHPLATGETTSDTEDVTIALRHKLMAEYRINVAYSGPLANRYAHARNAGPQGLLFDKRRDGQREIDHVCGIYAVPRNFYDVPVAYGTYQRGQIITLIYTDADDVPLYGLSPEAAKHVMVMDVDRDPITRTCTLTLWG